jgi:cold shock CspA family protein
MHGLRGQHFYGHLATRKRNLGTLPAERRGLETTGHILKLFVGQGYGFIRTAQGDREVYFHRSDVQVGNSINEFLIGDAVGFELLADHVSGPRALRVRRCASR